MIQLASPASRLFSLFRLTSVPRRLVSASLVVVIAAGDLSATNYRWFGGGGGTNWGLAPNWEFGFIPPTLQSSGTTTHVFMRGSGGTSRLATLVGTNADWTVDSLTFESAATGGFNITGGVLSLGNTFDNINAKVIRNSDTSVHTFSNERIELISVAPIRFDAAAGDLSFNTQVRFMLNNLTLELFGGNDVFFNGGIADEAFVTNATLDISGGTTAHIGSSASALTHVNVFNGTLSIASSANLSDSVDMTLSAGSVFDLNGFSENIDTITGSGTITVGGGSLTLGDASGFTFSGAITGTGGITKDQGGVLTLAGVSSYTGPTNITAGTLRLQNAGSLSSSTDVSLSTGAVFDLNGVTDTVDSISGSGTVLLGGGSLTVDEVSGVRTFSGNIQEAGTFRKLGGHTLTLTGNNSFTSLVVSGGTLNVATSSNLGAAGADIVLGSTLGITGSLTNSRPVFLANGTFDVSSAQTFTQSGVVQNNTTAASLTKTGPGTMVLTASNSYTGDTILSAGRLEISGGSERIHNSSDLVINGGVFDLNGLTETVGNLSGSGGLIDTGSSSGRLIVNQNGATTYSGAIVGAGGLTKLGTSTLNMAGISSYSGSTLIQSGTLRMVGGSLSSDTDVLINATWDLNGNSDTVDSISGTGNILLGGALLGVDQVGGTTTFSGVISGAGALSKSGSHTLVLSGNNTFTSGIAIFDGAVSVGSDANLGDPSGDITLALAGRLNTTGSFSTSRAIQLGMGATGTLDTAAGTTFTYAGALSGSTGNTLRKSGTGKLVLASSQSGYGGNYEIDAGTLELANFAGTALNSTSRITVNSGGTYVQNQAESFGSLAGAGNVVATNTLEVGLDNTSTTFSGVISGNLGSGFIRKAGTGTWTLSGLHTYFGATQIQGGTLRLSGSGRLPNTSDVTVTSPGVWDLNHVSDAIDALAGSGSVTLGSGTLTLGTNNGGGTYSGGISGTGGVVKQGSGTQIFSGTNTYGGSTTITGGTLQVANSANLGFGDLFMDGGRLQVTGSFTNARSVDLGIGGGIIGVSSGQTLTQSAVVGGTGPLTKVDPGTLVLTANNTYAGETVILTGILRLSGAGRLFDATDVSVSTGATWDLNGITDVVDSISGGGSIQLGGGTLVVVEGGGTRSFSGVISEGGSLVKQGTHMLTLSGNNTFTGGVHIHEGRLSIAANTNLGAATNDIVLDGGTLVTTAPFTMHRDIILGSNHGTIDVAGSFLSMGSGLISGDGQLIKTGTGHLSLADGNTYSGGTLIAQGSLEVTANSGLGANSGIVAISDGALLTSADFTNLHPIEVWGWGTIDVDGSELTHSAPLTGMGILTKEGDGVLVLTNAASHTGETIVSDGMLRLSGTGALPDSFNVTVKADGAWDLSGLDDTIDGLLGSGTVLLGGGTLTLGSADGAGNYAGRIFGTGELVKIGSGEQVLSGTGTHSQTLTAINGGALQVNSNIPLGAAGAALSFNGGSLHTTASFTVPRNVTLNTLGGTFDVDGSTTLTLANMVTGTGGLTKEGLGTLVLQANNNVGGPMNVMDGLVQLESTMTFGGLSGSGAIELGLNELIINSAGDYTFDGIISGIGGKLTKDGPGSLTLTGLNTYTGGTYILDGVVRIGQSENLGALGSLVEFDGGTLNATATFNMIRGMSLQAGGGTIDVDAGMRLGGSGNVTGVGSLTKIGDGVLSLVGGFSSYEGGTNILGGEIEINSNINLGNTIGSLTLDNGSLHTSNNVSMARLTTLGAGGGVFRTDEATTLTHSGAIVGNPGIAGVTKSGPGDMRWLGNNTFTGNIILESGRLQFSSSGQLGAAGNVIHMRGGGLHSLATLTNPRAILLESGGTTNTIEVDAATTLTQSGVISDGAMGPPLSLTKMGAGNLLLTSPNIYSSPTIIGAGTLRLSGGGRLPDVTDVTVITGATFDLNSVNDAVDALAGGGDVVLGSGTLTVGSANGGATFNGLISGAGSLRKVGTGRQIITARLDGQGAVVPNTYAGGNQIDGGILSIELDANLGASNGPLGLDGGELELVQRGEGGALNTQRVVTLGPGGGIFTTTVDTTATMQGVIGGTGSLTKQGVGLMTLSAANTYGGDTIIDGGLIRLSGAGRLPTTSRVEVNVATNMTTVQGLDLNNISNAINGLDGNGDVDLGTAILTVGSTGGNGSFGGEILGTGAVRKSGGGTQVFSGSNTYSGGTTFMGGVLQVPLNASLGNVAGGLTFDGGTLRTTGSFTMNRATQLNVAGGTIDVAGTTLLTHNGVFSGPGGLAKTGTGTFLVGASNTYGGPTNINTGILRLANVERLPNSTDLTIASGAVLDLNNFNETIDALSGSGVVMLGSASLGVGVNNGTGAFSGIITGTGDLLKEGGGVQTLTGQNSYSGATFVDGGELILSGGGTIDQSTTVVGFNIGSSGVATIEGAGTTWNLSGNLLVGLDGTARMNIRDAAVMSVEGDVRVGSNNQGLASAGTLHLDGGTLDNSAGNGIEVINGTLQGHGTIIGDVNSFDRTSPGSSAGILNITQNFVQSTSGTLALDIGGRDNSNPSNPQFDVLSVGGNLALDGLLEVSLFGGFQPLPSDTFAVAESSLLVGMFTNAANGARVNLTGGGTGSFQVNYGVSSPFGANRIVLSDFEGMASTDGDFDNSGTWDCADVDPLVAVIAAGSHNLIYDMNADGAVDVNDLTVWLMVAGSHNLPSGNAYLRGDANLDGSVGGADFVRWNANKFTSIASWCSGDFNADGSVNGADFVIWNVNKFTSADSSHVVAEPSGAPWLLLMLMSLPLISPRRARRV